MANLPINISAPVPAQANIKQPDNHLASQPEDQGFSLLLAQQVNESEQASTSARTLQHMGQPAEEQASSDAASSATLTGSADLLASLLVQQNPATTLQPATFFQPVTVATEGHAQTGSMISDSRSGLNINDKISSEFLSATELAKPEMPVQEKNEFTDNVGVLLAKEAATSKALPVLRNKPELEFSAAAPVLAGVISSSSAAPTVISTPLTQPAWGDDFGQTITWMATQRNQSAELHLNPPQLGPLDVTLKIQGDQASAVFISPHATVREAIEQALPKLREMLAENGIMLNNAMVGDQSARNNQDHATRDARNQSDSSALNDPGEALDTAVSMPSSISRHNGLVDTFA